MTDWEYSQKTLIHSGKCYLFNQRQADLLNVLLIADCKLNQGELYNFIYPNLMVNLELLRRIKPRIDAINQILQPMGWEILRFKGQVWIDKAEMFENGFGWTNEVLL